MAAYSTEFSRGMEREADFLGLQYMYKTGYDPTAFVDFFEKVQSMEKKKPGTVSKVFSTHPMTDDRIKASQEEIQKIHIQVLVQAWRMLRKAG
jgi:predicted Zn-dependent protease